MVTRRIQSSTPNVEPHRLRYGFSSVNNAQSELKSEPSNPGNSFSLDTVAQMNIRDIPVDVFTQYLSKQLKKSARLKERRKLKEKFILKLRKFGFDEEADLMQRCSANFSALVCDNGHSFRPIVDFRCHLPFCPDCWELKAIREMNRNLPKILQALRDNPSLILAFCTLTIVSDKKRVLRAGNRKIKDDFKALRRRDIWKENCAGGIGRIENTFSNRFGWHPHVHCLILLKEYIPQSFLSDAWNSITKDSKIVDIRQVWEVANGLVETIKYPFKPSDLTKLGKSQIQQMLNAKGDRLGLSFGVLFGLETESDNLASEYAEFVEETKQLKIGDCCPICQTRLDLVDFTVDSYADFLSFARIPQHHLIC